MGGAVPLGCVVWCCRVLSVEGHGFALEPDGRGMEGNASHDLTQYVHATHMRCIIRSIYKLRGFSRAEDLCSDDFRQKR